MADNSVIWFFYEWRNLNLRTDVPPERLRRVPPHHAPPAL